MPKLSQERAYGSRTTSSLEATFLTYWKQIVPRLAPPEPQYHFTDTRRFRLDFAFPAQKIGIELQGGTWNGGAHSRGTGQRRDCEKNNLAVLLGWRILYFTTDMLDRDPISCVNQVVSLLEPLPFCEVA